MAKGALGEYVVIEKGKVHVVVDSSEKLRSKAIGGISHDALVALMEKSQEELLLINKGNTTVLKYLGYYIDEQDMFVESAFVDSNLAESKGYNFNKIKYNHLPDMIVPTDNRFVMIWG